MKIYTSIPSPTSKMALTIGFFDGVHLGHRALFTHLKKSGSPATVLTFINPPYRVIKPQSPSLGLLTPWSLKLALMEQAGIDAVILLPFTLEFASQTYDALLSQFSLSHLILGEGSLFGKNREGDRSTIQAYAEKQGFLAQYISKTSLKNEIISSSAIRKTILSGNLTQAAHFLGRPHAFYFPANAKQISTQEICLPPDGLYSMLAGNRKVQLTIRTDSESRILTLDEPLPTQTLLSFDPEVQYV